jgi:Flp pilus assembly pilin Flp
MLELVHAIQMRVAAVWSKALAQEGQTMAEYAVVLAVITLVILGSLTALSGGISGALDKVTSILG